MTSHTTILRRSATAPAVLQRVSFRPVTPRPFLNRLGRQWDSHNQAVQRSLARGVDQLLARPIPQVIRKTGAKRFVTIGSLQFAAPSDFDSVLLEAQDPQSDGEPVAIAVNQGMNNLGIEESLPVLQDLIEARLLDQMDDLVGDAALASPLRITPVTTPAGTPPGAPSGRPLSVFSAVAKRVAQSLPKN